MPGTVDLLQFGRRPCHRRIGRIHQHNAPALDVHRGALVLRACRVHRQDTDVAKYGLHESVKTVLMSVTNSSRSNSTRSPSI